MVDADWLWRNSTVPKRMLWDNVARNGSLSMNRMSAVSVTCFCEDRMEIGTGMILGAGMSFLIMLN
jgi:hypothetical protein